MAHLSVSLRLGRSSRLLGMHISLVGDDGGGTYDTSGREEEIADERYP